MELYKSKYAQLHELVLQSWEREQAMLEKATTLRDAMKEETFKVLCAGRHWRTLFSACWQRALTFVFVTAHPSLQWQKALREQALEHSIVLSLEQEKEKAEKELRDAEEQEITLHCSVTELQVLATYRQPTNNAPVNQPH